uniref:Ale o 1 allergen n=1 Tax=Aleuroglyphus ovatus TaxID=212130 RepID=A7UNU0_ALEOV|nr:Ale o 1 allergen [Aleuroglyphus ovatus]
MKFTLVLGLALVALTSAHIPSMLLTEGELEAQFEQFKSTFGRVYPSPEIELHRKSIFRANLQFILRHNIDYFNGDSTFSVSVNNFTDLSNEEFRATFNGYRRLAAVSLADSVHADNDVEALPATVDWTTKGVVTPIKNQQQCGSCWAFSAVASMEGQHALKTGKLVSLSEQNLVDCSAAEGDMGCSGGWMDYAFKYVIQNRGIDTEASYPYKAIDESCEFKRNSVGATIHSFVDVKTGDESALQNAVASIGPISVAIDAAQPSFQFYSSGVYNEPDCSTEILDHGVTAVGYGTLNGAPYWKVKNSWGTSWGRKGYIFMSRNKQNQCGIATKASYPVV